MLSILVIIEYKDLILIEVETDKMFKLNLYEQLFLVCVFFSFYQMINQIKS
jgi:hypothetical protein